MIALLLIAALAATTGAAAYPPDPDCQEYRDGSTLDMTDCLRTQSQLWEDRLDKEYRAALERAEVDPTDLRKAQRAWLRYRNANCGAYASVRGSIRTILAATCWRDMTRSRTLELREMFWTG